MSIFLDEYDNFISTYDYTSIKEQIDVMKTLTFGTKINVLIVTDRLFGYATGLHDYMQNSTDISVELVNGYGNAKQIIDQKPIDFLVIAGCFRNTDNYDIIQDVRKYNKYAAVIMCAYLDSIITSICNENGIIYKFQRHEPIERFVKYMRQCYASETAKFEKDYSGNITKEQLRATVIQNEEYKERLREQAYIAKKKVEERRKIMKNIGMVFAIIFMVGIIFLDYYLKEFNVLNQKPDRLPNLVTASWMVTEDFGAYTSISVQSFVNAEPPVVYLDLNGEYHSESCEIYKDYNSPYWLDEIMYNYEYCQMCLTPELINNYIKAYDVMETNKMNNR